MDAIEKATTWRAEIDAAARRDDVVNVCGVLTRHAQIQEWVDGCLHVTCVCGWPHVGEPSPSYEMHLAAQVVAALNP
jgi:hypothetical protein